VGGENEGKYIGNRAKKCEKMQKNDENEGNWVKNAENEGNWV
jgi:hypothetical protein